MTPATAIGSLGVMHAELLCEALDVHPGERVLDVVTGDGAVASAAARRWADVATTDSATELPFAEDTFDVVLSAFGAMFSPDPAVVADELLRVCRPSGRIGMANWTPQSLIGDVLRAAGADSHALDWGTEGRLRELFGNRVRSLRVETRAFTFRFRSPDHMLGWFRGWSEQDRIATDLVEIFTRCNRADDGTLVASSDYAEVVAVVR